MSGSIRHRRGSDRGPVDFRRCRVWVAVVLSLLAPRGPVACGQASGPAGAGAQTAGTPSRASGSAVTLEELAERFRRLESQNAELAGQNRSLTHELEKVTRRCDELTRRLEQIEPAARPAMPPVPANPPPGPDSPPRAGAGTGAGDATPALPDLVLDAIADPAQAQVQAGRPGDPARPFGRPSTSEAGATPPGRRFAVGDYDDERKAFVLVRPVDPQRDPFELRLDIFTQARYFGFPRSKRTWTDSTGAVLPVSSYSSLEVTRNFVWFSGYAIDPRLQYSAILFSSTAINDTVFLGWINYRFNDALDVRVGNWVIPGTREWYESFRYTMGADRLMATTFFRPNISPGIWAQGEPLPNVHYVAMLANSLNRFTTGINRVGQSGAFGGTVWWEPMGRFGPGPSDIEGHEELALRVGTNLALSHESNQGYKGFGVANPEDTILRLSDGTPLFRPGALGPGVVLRSTDVQLWTVDAAAKYRGAGIMGEYFFRWLDHFQGGGTPALERSLFDTGGLLQASYFLVPGKFEAFGRTSFVVGPFGGGDEFGGGLNWYPRSSRDWRFTLEVLQINGSPAQNLLTGYRAGASGTLFQLQWFSDF
jgi:hypothetical protein